MPRHKEPSLTSVVEPLLLKSKSNKEISIQLDEPLWRIQNYTGYIRRKWRSEIKKDFQIHKLPMRGNKS